MDRAAPPSSAMASGVLRPGDTCWRVARADRISVIVDAAPHFALHAALRQARHSVIMIGWEFDTRISLAPQKDGDGVPTRLGKFLSWLVRQNPELTPLCRAQQSSVTAPEL